MTTNKIIDKFSDLPISRQRKYQLRNKVYGLCILCSEKAVPGMSRCLKHEKKRLEQIRLRTLAINKYKNTKLRRYLRSMAYIRKKNDEAEIQQ